LELVNKLVNNVPQPLIGQTERNRFIGIWKNSNYKI